MKICKKERDIPGERFRSGTVMMLPRVFLYVAAYMKKVSGREALYGTSSSVGPSPFPGVNDIRIVKG